MSTSRDHGGFGKDMPSVTGESFAGKKILGMGVRYLKTI